MQFCGAPRHALPGAPFLMAKLSVSLREFESAFDSDDIVRKKTVVQVNCPPLTRRHSQGRTAWRLSARGSQHLQMGDIDGAFSL